MRLWSLIKHWLHLHALDSQDWHSLTLEEWWMKMSDNSTPNRKAMVSLVVPTSSEIWNERNARVFRNKFAPPTVVLEIIKREAFLWATAGAKCLSILLPRE